MVKKGDLILEKSGGGDLYPVGRVVRVNSDQKATCSNFAHTIATNDNISSNFLYYYFFNLYSKGVSRLFFNQTTGIQNLKVGEYLSQDMYAPSKPEQEAIANYLDKKTDEIDRTISAIKNECNLYKEYKQSLISEVVTGKRKVID
jgi:type I restriction enzyme S subunit